MVAQETVKHLRDSRNAFGHQYDEFCRSNGQWPQRNTRDDHSRLRTAMFVVEHYIARVRDGLAAGPLAMPS
jgi:hypothetical protein